MKFTLAKHTERYIINYDTDSRAEALRTLGRWATNPELSFTWLDAACGSQAIRVGPIRQNRIAGVV